MVLIDYDSGVVVDRPEDAPTTFGKGDEWVAPEINAQRSQASDGQSTVTVDLLTDTWSVAVGVHYFLFACFPYFYLHVLGPRELEAYVSRYRWPEVDPSYDNFEADNSEFYAHYRQTYAATQDSLKRPFEATFWKGADAISRNARASYRQWIQVLEPLVVRTRFRPPTTVSTLAAQPTPAAQVQPPQPQLPPTRPAPAPGLVPRQTPKPPPTPAPPQPKATWPRLVGLVVVALVIGVIYTIGNKPQPVRRAQYPMQPPGVAPPPPEKRISTTWPPDKQFRTLGEADALAFSPDAGTLAVAYGCNLGIQFFLMSRADAFFLPSRYLQKLGTLAGIGPPRSPTVPTDNSLHWLR